MKKLFLQTCLLIFGLSPIMGQESPGPCGTPAVKSEWLSDFQRHPEKYPLTRGGTEYVPLTIHIVGTDEGAGYFSEPSLLRALCTLNEDFEQANIQFFIAGEINYLNNSDWYDHEFPQGLQMMNQNNVNGTANCYIVSSPAGNCGYFNPQGDAVALMKGCLQPTDHTWAHEMGHFFSLPHTFFGWEYFDEDPDYTMPAPTEIDGGWNTFQVEKVDGSNCSAAADGFCDTSPDYLPFLWTCNNDGLSGQDQTDPNGEIFKSDGSFIMSYSNDVCAGVFSDQQINAMQANLLFFRPNLQNNYIPFELGDDIHLLHPAPGEIVANANSVLLEWEPVANASHYLVEISPLPNFPFVYFRYTTSESSFTTTDLLPNEQYYWRIIPYNRHSTCMLYSESSEFSTAALSSTEELAFGNAFGVLGNPVKSGSDIQLWVEIQQAVPAEISVIDLHGRTRMGPISQYLSGAYQEISVPGASLPAGWYVIQIATAEGYLQQRILITN